MEQPTNVAMYDDDDVAQLYVRLNGWSEADDIYLGQVMAATRVLDVGCGPGRLLQEARRAGHSGELVGIDPDRAALAIARTDPSIRWLDGVAATMPFVADFDLAVMTGHAFQCLIADEEIRASLRGIHRALTPGGTFAFETRNPTARAWETWGSMAPLAVVDHRGEDVLVSYEILAVEDDVVTLTETTARPDGTTLRIDEGKLRFLSPERLNDELQAAGFTIVAQYGDWAATPFTSAHSELIIVARID